jgi:hypothetical protein
MKGNMLLAAGEHELSASEGRDGKRKQKRRASSEELDGGRASVMAVQAEQAGVALLDWGRCVLVGKGLTQATSA